MTDRPLTTEEIDALSIDELRESFSSLFGSVVIAYGDDGQPVGTRLITEDQERETDEASTSTI